ncbi:MAG: glycosyltransferase family 4 protein [Candidatus Hodarchaeota archaeon]
MKLFQKIIDLTIKVIDSLFKYNKKSINLLRQNLLVFGAKVLFLTSDINWSIFWDGKSVTENLKKLKLINAEVISPNIVSFLIARNKIIHWGSVDYLIDAKRFSYLSKSNKHVALYAHFRPNDARIKFIPSINKIVDIMHTPNSLNWKKLIEMGFDKEKTIIMPIGVDLKRFKKVDKNEKLRLREKFNLPKEKTIIGSFQKDGFGWGKGLEPKLEKGPDIFCEVVKKINEEHDIHILLIGPARGFVKNKLKEYQIPHTHIFLKHYLNIVEYYNVLDLYIVTSRSEGGPKALLESLATGVPIVTTNMGMAPDIIEHEFNGFIAEVDNVNQLSKYSIELINNEELREKFASNGLSMIHNYSWENISKKYYYKIYKRLL